MWQTTDLIAAEQYWFDRFCDRFGWQGSLRRQYPGVSSLCFTGPHGGIKQVDLDDELLFDQLNAVPCQRGQEILESWLIFSISNPDPLAQRNFDPTDRQYFHQLEQSAVHCHVYSN